MSGDERREEFLNAAAAIVLELGTAAVTMNSVANRTGVTKRLGYRYFDNRIELIKALIDREMAQVGRRAGAVLSPDASFEEVIRVNTTVWLQLFEERGPLLSRLLFGQDVVPTIAADLSARSTHRWRGDWGDFLQVDDATAEILARMYLAALRGAVDALERKLAPLDEIASIYTTVVMAGGKAVTDRRRALDVANA
jgi:AcrR family transcriptional regulator